MSMRRRATEVARPQRRSDAIEPARLSGPRRQVVLGVLQGFFDRRNAGGVARLALLDAVAGVDALRLLAALGTHVEILLVLVDQRLAVLRVARLREGGCR